MTLAEAALTDGQRLLAFNDLFIGAHSTRLGALPHRAARRARGAVVERRARLDRRRLDRLALVGVQHGQRGAGD